MCSVHAVLVLFVSFVRAANQTTVAPQGLTLRDVLKDGLIGRASFPASRLRHLDSALLCKGQPARTGSRTETVPLAKPEDVAVGKSYDQFKDEMSWILASRRVGVGGVIEILKKRYGCVPGQRFRVIGDCRGGVRAGWRIDGDDRGVSKTVPKSHEGFGWQWVSAIGSRAGASPLASGAASQVQASLVPKATRHAPGPEVPSQAGGPTSSKGQITIAGPGRRADGPGEITSHPGHGHFSLPLGKVAALYSALEQISYPRKEDVFREAEWLVDKLKPALPKGYCFLQNGFFSPSLQYVSDLELRFISANCSGPGVVSKDDAEALLSAGQSVFEGGDPIWIKVASSQRDTYDGPYRKVWEGSVSDLIHSDTVVLNLMGSYTLMSAPGWRVLLDLTLITATISEDVRRAKVLYSLEHGDFAQASRRVRPILPGTFKQVFAKAVSREVGPLRFVVRQLRFIVKTSNDVVYARTFLHLPLEDEEDIDAWRKIAESAMQVQAYSVLTVFQGVFLDVFPRDMKTTVSGHFGRIDQSLVSVALPTGVQQIRDISEQLADRIIAETRDSSRQLQVLTEEIERLRLAILGDRDRGRTRDDAPSLLALEGVGVESKSNADIQAARSVPEKSTDSSGPANTSLQAYATSALEEAILGSREFASAAWADVARKYLSQKASANSTEVSGAASEASNLRATKPGIP